MDNYIICLNKDLNLYQENSKVCVTGIIRNRWSKKNRFGIEIADLTGSARISFVNAKASYDRNCLTIGKRIRAYGLIIVDKKGSNCIGIVEKIELLDEISLYNNELDIIEQESLISLSQICNTIRDNLGEAQFVEIASRVFSRRIGDEILEPLLIDFPGFGSSLFLSPSPSSQLSEFLTVTMLPKVFTVTYSFSTSYRFPKGSCEMPIIMAKAINLSEKEEMNIIESSVRAIVETLSNKTISIHCENAKWDNTSELHDLNEGEFSLLIYSTEIPTMGKFWNSIVNIVKRLHDDNGNLLLECMHEKINDRIDICSITYYPTQFLNWTSRAPKRQIQNLWKIFDGGIIYG